VTAVWLVTSTVSALWSDEHVAVSEDAVTVKGADGGSARAVPAHVAAVKVASARRYLRDSWRLKGSLILWAFHVRDEFPGTLATVAHNINVLMPRYSLTLVISVSKLAKESLVDVGDTQDALDKMEELRLIRCRPAASEDGALAITVIPG
jgi:hypothetical protein